MPNPCTVCRSPHNDALNSRLASGESGKSLAKELGLSLPAVYRHIRSGHYQTAAIAIGSDNSASPVPALAPQISATLRDVQRLAREAWRHLRDARKAGDHKATNGAITASAKALELVGKLRGELQHGQSTTVNVSLEARIALDLQSQAAALDATDVVEQARSYLAALVGVGDRDAVRAVLELVRLLPDAEVVPEAGSIASERVAPSHQ